jgi:low affinity Fe/Cu permease
VEQLLPLTIELAAGRMAGAGAYPAMRRNCYKRISAMSPKQAKALSAASSRDRRAAAGTARPLQPADNGATRQDLFASFAGWTARHAGHPLAFAAAILIIVAWALTGPLFGYSDTWQLIINTSTTIVTFLMVFLIQNTQYRDALAVQIKLAELIVAARGAENGLATVEDLSEEELQALHDDYRQRAEQALDHLSRRREQSQ